MRREAEAEDQAALSRGMRALGIRIARCLNRALERSGSVFADRYRAHQLSAPSQVCNALPALARGLAGAGSQRVGSIRLARRPSSRRVKFASRRRT